jgi:uncharacterized protein YbjT (DUF2867 family)
MLLLTGATGYIGGRLLLRLETEKHRVRCLCRHPHALQSRVAPGTEVVKGDLNDAESLRAAMVGIHTAYYLVHSLGESGAF